ncbi:hypothetical protein L0222_28945 [bacterium]|nr:hypothetical protein [bacterium]MCI0601708.1 hypothetical protein [bacterium]
MRINSPASHAGAPIDSSGKPEEIQPGSAQKIQEHDAEPPSETPQGLTPLEEAQTKQLTDTIKAEREQEADRTRDKMQKKLEEEAQFQLHVGGGKKKDEDR